MFDMHREAAAKRPGVLTKVGLDTFVDPDREGCAMNEAAQGARRQEGPVRGRGMALFPGHRAAKSRSSARRRPMSAAISPANRKAPSWASLDLAMAAHNNGGIVIAQVKRIVEAGSLKTHNVRVPGILVDYVVEAPEQWQTTQTVYDPGDFGRDLPADVELRADGVGHRQGHRAPRGAGAEEGLGRQSWLWRLRQCAAHLPRRRPCTAKPPG